MYKVIRFFTDLQDNAHAYNVGDEFPHKGITVSPERLNELSTGKNRRGTPLIEEVIEDLPFTEKDPVEVPEEPKAEEKPKPKSRGKKKG